MTVTAPSCPTCHSDLALQRGGDFNPWLCALGHGMAATMSEAYERAQEDELDDLWRQAKQAPSGHRACPMCAAAMAAVDLGYDDDEAMEGAAGDAPAAGSIALDMCTACQVIWFDAGELDVLPADLEDAKPSDAELAHVDQIGKAFADSIEAAHEDRIDDELAERIYQRIKGRKATQAVSRLFRRTAAAE